MEFAVLRTIRRKGSVVEDRGVVGLLLECHARIWTFVAMADSIALAQSASESDISDAAQRVRRYFAVALPLHEQDEELSIAPRLLSSNVDANTRGVLSTMADDHALSRKLLTLLDEHWAALAESPRKVLDSSTFLAAKTAELRALFARHLVMEESLVFPLVEQLPEEVRADIVAEMRARRR
jgi:hemerythrin-like domain-containing protein